MRAHMLGLCRPDRLCLQRSEIVANLPIAGGFVAGSPRNWFAVSRNCGKITLSSVTPRPTASAAFHRAVANLLRQEN